MRKRRLLLVEPNPQFDLNKFKTGAPAQPTPTPRRRRRPQITEPFAPITYTLARKLQSHRIGGEEADDGDVIHKLFRPPLSLEGAQPCRSSD